VASQQQHHHQRLKHAFEALRQALEDAESALLELEQTLFEQKKHVRGALEPRGQEEEDLLSILEVCQQIGMSKSWVHKRIKSGEIPSIRLGNNIKVRPKELQEYLESSRYHPLGDEQDSARGR
jgi:excisionase family DNA binding protein